MCGGLRRWPTSLWEEPSPAHGGRFMSVSDEGKHPGCSAIYVHTFSHRRCFGACLQKCTGVHTAQTHTVITQVWRLKRCTKELSLSSKTLQHHLVTLREFQVKSFDFFFHTASLKAAIKAAAANKSISLWNVSVSEV